MNFLHFFLHFSRFLKKPKIFFLLLPLNVHALYTVTQQETHYEVRDYKPSVIIQIDSKESSLLEDFMLLRKYLKGANKDEKVFDMPSPVYRIKKGESGWLIALPMDASCQDLPQPDNNRIKTGQLKNRTVAVIRFSGRWTYDNFAEHEQKLKSYLTSVPHEEDPIFVYYNSPFSLPFLRRNEVHLILK